MKKIKWEYKIEENTDNIDKLGAEGWELVAVTETEGEDREGYGYTNITYYFKRPIYEKD